MCVFLWNLIPSSFRTVLDFILGHQTPQDGPTRYKAPFRPDFSVRPRVSYTKLVHIERTETRTETRFETVQNKEVSFSCLKLRKS
jgi:hypothetical protein